MFRLLLSLKILLPNVHPKDPTKRLLKVKLLLYMISSALGQLNKGGEPQMKAYTEKMPDRIFQWSIINNYNSDSDLGSNQPLAAAYLRVKAGNSKSGRGLYTRKRPIVHMKFKSVEGAYKVLTSQVDVVTAVVKDYMVIEGPPEYGKDIGVFMKRIETMITQ